MPTEHDHQRALIAWAKHMATAEPSLAFLSHLFAIPNGGGRNAATAGRLKAEGVLAGVPDLFLPVARGGYHGLWIEMKKEGGRASKSQEDFFAFLRGQKYYVAVCLGCEAAKDEIIKYTNL